MLAVAALSLIMLAQQSTPRTIESCAHPYTDATTVNAVSPDYPDAARKLHLGPKTVLVRVTIDPTGKLVNASISQSSGNIDIDRAALRAAMQSTYTPATANCKPIQGSYIFRTDFESEESDPIPKSPLVPIPSLSPPPGWKRTDLQFRTATSQTFAEWTNGKRFLTLDGGMSTGTIAQMRGMGTLVQRYGGSVSVNQAVKICGGTQDGWMLVYARTSPRGVTQDVALVGTVRGRVAYWANYFTLMHAEPPDAQVLASMESLCAPAAADNWVPPIPPTPKPGFLPGNVALPRGWQKTSATTWNAGTQVISVVPVGCSPSCRAQKPGDLYRSPIRLTLVRNEKVAICGGRQQAWLRELKRSSPGDLLLTLWLVPLNPDVRGTLAYTGFRDPIPADVLQAMLAACMPYTR